MKGDLLNSAPKIKLISFYSFLWLKSAFYFLQKIARNFELSKLYIFFNLPEVFHWPADEAFNLEPEHILERALPKTTI